jgi:hypothetical protein
MQTVNKEPDEVEVAIPTNFFTLPHKRDLLLTYLMEKQTVDPIDVKKDYIEPDIKISVNTTHEYFTASLAKWLRLKRYDLVFYYYKSLQELTRLCPIVQLTKEIDDSIKNQFNQHCAAF